MNFAVGQMLVCKNDLPMFDRPGQFLAHAGDQLTVIEIDENGLLVESDTASFYVVEDEVTEVEL